MSGSPTPVTLSPGGNSSNPHSPLDWRGGGYKKRAWLTVVPAVYLDAAAALQQGSDVGISRGLAVELVCLQVRVVAGVYEVVRERLGHVLKKKEEEFMYIIFFLFVCIYHESCGVLQMDWGVVLAAKETEGEGVM